ncbi:MAG: aspartyl protease family protein [Candidatus Rokubacteria bacterium]|nr:aspartyl protease family protein [Candidatus Rokubacteria bacterium]
MIRGWAAASLLVCVLFPAGVCAQVYHWVDEQGTIHYATELESVPKRYRSGVRLVPVPRAPTAVEGEPSPPSAAITTIRFTPGAPILVEARINGAGPVTLVLDTGADRTVVAPVALWRLGIQTPNTFRAEIKGVTGASPADVVWVSAVEVGGLSVGPLPIVAHDAELPQADGLLGRDFLSFFTVTIDASASVVTLTRK